RHERPQELPLAPRAPLKEAREEYCECEFRNLRRLHREAREANPAARAAYRREGEHAREQHDREREQAVRDSRTTQPTVLEAPPCEHREQSDCSPQPLPHHVVIL